MLRFTSATIFSAMSELIVSVRINTATLLFLLGGGGGFPPHFGEFALIDVASGSVPTSRGCCGLDPGFNSGLLLSLCSRS